MVSRMDHRFTAEDIFSWVEHKLRERERMDEKRNVAQVESSGRRDDRDREKDSDHSNEREPNKDRDRDHEP